MVEDFLLDILQEESSDRYDEGYRDAKEVDWEEAREEGWNAAEEELKGSNYISEYDYDQMKKELYEHAEQRFCNGYANGYKDGADWRRPQFERENELKEYDYDD
jgi:hypothetical protein